MPKGQGLEVMGPESERKASLENPATYKTSPLPFDIMLRNGVEILSEDVACQTK